jgi:hypothetical protein
MIALLALIGVILSFMSYDKTQPLRVYKRLDIENILSLESWCIIIFLSIFAIALLGGK